MVIACQPPASVPTGGDSRHCSIVRGRNHAKTALLFRLSVFPDWDYKRYHICCFSMEFPTCPPLECRPTCSLRRFFVTKNGEYKSPARKQPIIISTHSQGKALNVRFFWKVAIECS